MDKTNQRNQYSIKQKLLTLVAMAIVPLFMVSVYLIFSLFNYSKTYDSIVDNLAIANDYNLSFKEAMDESLYKIVVGHVTFETIDLDDTLENPYTMINNLREDVGKLQDNIDSNSRIWLNSLLGNVSTLEARIHDIEENLNSGDNYDVNIEMLNDDIYILTDLIQDDIQYFIYYQTINIESLQQVLNSRVKGFTVFWLSFCAVIVVIIIVFATVIVRNITDPLNHLCHVTDKIAKGDFDTRAKVETDDEITELAHSVNHMSGHLEVMVEHIKEDERKMRYAELRLLQEQINPHFLYNTLDSIVWLIEIEQNEEAINMVMSLSEFFRLVLSKGKEFISIKDEERHIRSYLEIQQIRYRDILDFDIDIDEDIYECKILKMTLQPLVENSLYHGIKCKRGKGKIEVRGYREGDKIVLTVSDNGVGIDEDTLEKLRVNINRPCKETENGFGLANVNERIHVNFGFDYGITIDSVVNEGTNIRLEIPVIIMESQEVVNE